MFKSIKTSVLAAILITTGVYAQAQKKISEGTAVYTIQYSLTPEQAQYEAMFPKESKVKFKDNLSKIEMEQGPALITIISDVTTKTGLLLVDVPIAQKQYAVKTTKADYDKAREGAPQFSDFKATGEKKMIGSYNAEKYTHKDEKGAQYELWVTQDADFAPSLKPQEFSSVKGSLVQYTSVINGLKSVLTLKSIKEGKAGELPLTPPSGYEIKTMAELEAMRSGG